MALMALFVALASPSLPACRESYTVRHAANPNPLRHVRTFAVEPLHWAPNLRVEGKSELDWLAKQPEETRRAWPAGKTAMIASFQRGLAKVAGDDQIVIVAAPAPPGTHVIRAALHHVEPGFFSGPVSSDTLVEIDIEIVSPEGVVLDAITSRGSVPATALNLDLSDRLRDGAEDVGENVARYLRDRTGS